MKRSWSLGIAVAAGACVLSLLTLAGCGDNAPLGPPAINRGRDTCIECGMIINEDRFAAAMNVETGGVQERRLFDDIGDMLDYDQSHPDIKVLARYVHAFEGERWLIAQDASYLISETVATPMASGIIAFADVPAAEAGRAKHHGQTLSWEQVRKQRVESKRK